MCLRRASSALVQEPMLLLLLNENILPPHPNAAAGVNLQANHAIGELRRVVDEVHDLHAIELRHDVIALHGYLQVVPLAWFQRLLAFRRWHLHPAAPAAFVKPAGMLAYAWIHLDLHPFDVRSMFVIDSR